MVRKLKFHEQKLLKKVDFISWEVDNNVHEAKVMRKFHLKKRDEYTASQSTSKLLDKLYDIGLIPTKRSLELCDKVSASSFCRRRLPVIMVNSNMAESIAVASQFVEQGHVRVGPEVVLDPAFLVNRNLEDFITWTNASAIKKHVLEYNEMRDDFDLNA